MEITKKGCIVPFKCGLCESKFLAGINSVVVEDGNFYVQCPMCKAECHYDIAKFLGERMKAQKGGKDAD